MFLCISKTKINNPIKSEIMILYILIFVFYKNLIKMTIKIFMYYNARVYLLEIYDYVKKQVSLSDIAVLLRDKPSLVYIALKRYT